MTARELRNALLTLIERSDWDGLKVQALVADEHDMMPAISITVGNRPFVIVFLEEGVK